MEHRTISSIFINEVLENGKVTLDKPVQLRAATDPVVTDGPIISGTANSGLYPNWPYLSIIGSYRRPNLLHMFPIIPVGPAQWPVIYKEVANSSNAAAPVIEGATKPYTDYSTYQNTLTSYLKVASLLKLSDEVIADTPQYEWLVEERLLYDLHQEIGEQILYGTGVSPQILGMANNSAVATTTQSSVADAIIAGMATVAQNNGRRADGVVISNADFQSLLVYSFPNSTFATYEQIFGLQLMVSDIINQGNILVGCFAGGAFIGERELTLDATKSNVDDFENNLVTTRAEWRGFFGLINPDAFCMCYLSS